MNPRALAVVLFCLAFVFLNACGGGSANGGGNFGSGDGGGSQTGSPLYVSNSSSASVSFYLLNQTSGALQQVAGSPIATGGSSPDSLAVDPGKKFLLVGNLSSSNISVFSVNNSTAALTAVSGSPFPSASSVVRLAVNPNGKFVYALSSTPAQILGFSLDSTTGALTALTGFPHSLSASGETGLAISPNGLFLYTSNPGTDLITSFSIGTDGSLTQLGTIAPKQGSPSFLTFDTTGSFLFGVNAGGSLGASSISTLAVATSGALTEVTNSPTAVGTTPVSAVFSTGFLFVLNQTSGTISAFSFVGSTGVLSEVKGSPFAVGAHPISLSTAALGRFLIATTTGSSGGGTIAVFSIGTDGALTAVTGSPFTPDTPTPDQVLAF